MSFWKRVMQWCSVLVGAGLLLAAAPVATAASGSQYTLQVAQHVAANQDQTHAVADQLPVQAGVAFTLVAATLRPGHAASQNIADYTTGTVIQRGATDAAGLWTVRGLVAGTYILTQQPFAQFANQSAPVMIQLPQDADAATRTVTVYPKNYQKASSQAETAGQSGQASPGSPSAPTSPKTPLTPAVPKRIMQTGTPAASPGWWLLGLVLGVLIVFAGQWRLRRY
ncbi:hypothetical protein [Schleiferilactobacillus harbinensis]|uniref:hypothetical protein n=2 Tax=Schleiferilactobacillus harbinensis TaxID=304207 RepID=UPI00345E6853